MDKAVEFVLSCMNFDGGFGRIPGSESHAGQVCVVASTVCVCLAVVFLETITAPPPLSSLPLPLCQVYCCVGALAVANALHHVDADQLGWWLCERQLPSGGLNGRDTHKCTQAFTHIHTCMHTHTHIHTHTHKHTRADTHTHRLRESHTLCGLLSVKVDRRSSPMCATPGGFWHRCRSLAGSTGLAKCVHSLTSVYCTCLQTHYTVCTPIWELEAYEKAFYSFS